MSDLLTADDIAAYLRVSRATVCRWCSLGKLPAFKIGKGWRVRRSDFTTHLTSVKRSLNVNEPAPATGSAS
jgi:excisionase family DNA binding protein